MKHIVIIGAGPAGLMSAITLKEKIQEIGIEDKINITILEKNDRIGKKIMSTGNGRCNYSNINIYPEFYNNQNFVKPILESFSSNQLQDWFLERGLVSKVDSEGRVYPVSDHASSVVDLFRLLIAKNNITLKTSFDVKEIKIKKDKYLISNNEETLEADYIIMSTGGKAAPALGSNGSGLNLLKGHKIKITKTYPGLVGIKTTKETVKGLSGLRMKGEVSLYSQTKQLLYKELGEVQFKDDGISGIVVMNVVSRLMHYDNKMILEIDLLPILNEKNLKEYILNKIKKYSDNNISELFTGLFHSSFSNKLFKDFSLNLNNKLSSLKEEHINNIISYIKHYKIDYLDTYGYDRAQVTVGGVSLDEINNTSLELHKLARIYVCGEIIDIDGMCGGYNLHFAYASGNYVARKIIDKLK